jgi:hypothetical protein
MKVQIRLGLGALMLLCSLSASADYGRYGMITCSTSSNGYNFSDESLDRELAKTQSINHCTSSSYTVNAECRANVLCSDEYNRPMIQCTTSSNNYDFSAESRDRSVAVTSAVNKCAASSYTSNDECRSNVACNDGYNAPMVQCTTSSNGYNFADQSRDPVVAKNQTINQCAASSYTSNAECRANVSCQGEYSAPMVQCETSSNGYRFNDESRDPEVAKTSTLNLCTASSYTNNAECRANLWCTGGQSQDPQYPRDPRNPYPNPTPNPWPLPPSDPYPTPAPNPWPVPVPPRDPRPNPRPEPRPIPAPPREELCTVSRFDPAGMFIQSYRGTGRSSGDACVVAQNMCQREIKGRQYCR